MAGKNKGVTSKKKSRQIARFINEKMSIFIFSFIGISIYIDAVFASNKALSEATKFSNIFTNIAENSIPSIVLVTAFKERKQSSSNSDVSYQKIATGSGFIISPDGYILTSGHVIKDSTNITIYYDEQEVLASCVKISEDIDIAILKIDGSDLPYLEIGDSNKTRIGEWIVSIGYPFSIGPFLTLGVVSSKNSKLLANDHLSLFLFTDVLINPGNSGGPILNLKNEVIGVCTGVLLSKEDENAVTDYKTGIGVAIPINAAKQDIRKFINFDRR